ncbi:MAG: 30S ribosomal protein S5 [Patescibacteria group bacterium]
MSTQTAEKTKINKTGRRQTGRRQMEKSEFDHQVVDIRRVTRVMAGGRRFSFSATVIVGDKRGRVGVGVGKAGDTAAAIAKAITKAQKNVIKLKLTEDRSIPHEVSAKFKSSKVYLQPAAGRGLIAGSSLRTVLHLAGINDVNGKFISRTKNKLNNAQVAILALSEFKENNKVVEK